MTTQLASRSGIVTGAGTLFGRRIASKLICDGARLLLADLDLRDLDVNSFDAANPPPIYAGIDLTDADAVGAAAAVLEEATGKIDFLVVASERYVPGEFAIADPAGWCDMVNQNLLATLFAVRAVLPSMLQSVRGHIVLLNGVAGLWAEPGAAMYSATKWGVTGLGRALWSELADKGVAVTLVQSGTADRVDSPVSQDRLATAVAEAVDFTLRRPAGVAVTEIVVRVS